MRNAFVKFRNEFIGKSFNEILGCAKSNIDGLRLIRDVDEYNDNKIACEVRYFPNADIGDFDKSIVVECVLKNDKVGFTFINSKIVKFGRVWEVLLEFDDLETIPNSTEFKWWEVITTEEGKFYMNNYDGEIVFISKDESEMLISNI